MAIVGSKFDEAVLGQYGSVYTTASSDAIIPPTNYMFVAITMLADTVFDDASGGLTAQIATKFINTADAAHDLAAGAETEVEGSGGLIIGGSAEADAVTFPKGITLYGRWTEIDVYSGSVIAYLAPIH